MSIKIDCEMKIASSDNQSREQAMNALISGRAGVALVVDGERLATIHAGDPAVMVDRQPSELRLLAGEMRDFVPVENVSREEIGRRLLRTANQEDGLQLVLIILDSDLPEDIRAEAVQELDLLLEVGDLAGDLECVFYAEPLPEQADQQGALALAEEGAARRTAAFFEALVVHQATIREVREAWQAVPSSDFSQDQESWQSMAVREGLFRSLVLNRAAGKNVNDFLVEAGVRPAIHALPGHRDVLRAWIRPFARPATPRRS